jgi:hypothetical protein
MIQDNRSEREIHRRRSHARVLIKKWSLKSMKKKPTILQERQGSRVSLHEDEEESF